MVDQEILQVMSSAKGLTKAVLSNLLPDEFEYYLVALEVRDDTRNELKDVMIFPVNPESIMTIKNTFTTMKKSFSGVHINDNNSFTPNPINLSGTFGRKPRSVVTVLKEVSVKSPLATIKTGYGATKLLQKIIDLGKSTNAQGNPYRTIFYNLPFGEVLTVIVNDCKFNMTMENNMMWRYDLNMTAVAPGDINPNFNLKKNTMYLQGLNSATKLVNRQIDKLLKLVV